MSYRLSHRNDETDDMKKTRDTWSAVDPIAWQCLPSWPTNRCCALFSILFASLVRGDHLVFGFSVYFFDVMVSSVQCVERPVVN